MSASIQEILKSGAMLGLGVATQNVALDTLQKVHPAADSILGNPLYREAVKMGLPIFGLYLSGKISNPDVAAKVRAASQGMLLANSINLAGEVSLEIFGQIGGMIAPILMIYGVSQEEAFASASKIGEDISDMMGVGSKSKTVS